MKISVIGLGWFGQRIGEELQSKGHVISGTTRTPEKKKILEDKGLNVDLLNNHDIPQHIVESDIIILNIPPFEGQLDWFKTWKWNKNTWIIFISSTSVIPSPDSRSGEILFEEERWIKENFEKWTILRFGGLLGDDRHPGKYLSGRKNLSGRKWPVNLIHLEDCVGVTLAIIENKIMSQTIDAVADDHPTREEFYTEYCKKKGIPLPEFDLSDESVGKLVSNAEMRAFYQPKVQLMNIKV
jgi:nucleoside-diphosphate-sugar epimerase